MLLENKQCVEEDKIVPTITILIENQLTCSLFYNYFYYNDYHFHFWVSATIAQWN